MKYRNVLVTESLWEQPRLREYLGEVARRHGVVETLALPNMRDLPPVRIDKLFVQPLLSQLRVDISTPQENWPVGESLLSTLESCPQLVLLGDPGSGKTTLANWLAWRLSSGLTTVLPDILANKIPIPCILREMDRGVFESNISVAELSEVVVKGVLGPKAASDAISIVRAYIDAGAYVLIVDGIDEIPISGRRKVSEWVRQAVADRACVVGTARIIGYDDYPVDRPALTFKNSNEKYYADEESSWREQKISNASSWAAIRYLMPFDQKRVNNFVGNWYLQRSGNDMEAKKKADDLLQALSKSPQMQELSRTPNLLSLMAIVHRERANLPDGKALLYKEISNAYINTIDQHRKIVIGDSIARFSWEIKENWIAYVAFRMQEERTEAKNKSAEVGLLAHEDDVIRWLSEAMAASTVAEPEITARAFLEWVGRRCGLLIPRGSQEYAFVHLSFQEYFCARYMAGRIMSRPFIKNALPEDAPVTRDKLYQWSSEVDWIECFVFLFEIISAEHDIDWVQDLAEILFKKSESDKSSFGEKTKLAARVLADHHIHLLAEWRQTLASACARDAFDEWIIGDVNNDILKNLVDTEFASIFIDDRRALGDFGKSIAFRGIEASKNSDLLKDLYVFMAHGKALDDIENIGVASKLRYLSLARTSVRDLSPLRFCADLRIIAIHGGAVEDISVLENLCKLTTIEVTDAGVKEIPDLTRLASLHIVDFDGTPISDVENLVSVKRLGFLSLSDTRVLDITPLGRLKRLRYLHLRNTDVSDLSILSLNETLLGLEISGTKVQDLSPIIASESLRELDVIGLPLQDLGLLENMKKITRLRIGGPNVFDISFVSRMTSLQYLELHGSEVVDISHISRMSELKSIKLVKTKIKDFSPLLALDRSVQLEIDDKKIVDLRGYIKALESNN